jgi:hypothetical protein
LKIECHAVVTGPLCTITRQVKHFLAFVGTVHQGSQQRTSTGQQHRGSYFRGREDVSVLRAEGGQDSDGYSHADAGTNGSTVRETISRLLSRDSGDGR